MFLPLLENKGYLLSWWSRSSLKRHLLSHITELLGQSQGPCRSSEDQRLSLYIIHYSLPPKYLGTQVWLLTGSLSGHSTVSQVTVVWLCLCGDAVLTWVVEQTTSWRLIYVLTFPCVAVSLIFGQFKLFLLVAHSGGGVQTRSSGGYRSRQRSGSV